MRTITDLLLNDDGTLPAWAWPGGYPILYVDRQNSCLCPKCANKSIADFDELPAFKPVRWYIHYEGPPEQCDQCCAQIESAYGDPFEQE